MAQETKHPKDRVPGNPIIRLQELTDRIASGQELEQEGDRNSGASKARTAAHLLRIPINELLGPENVHSSIVRHR